VLGHTRADPIALQYVCHPLLLKARCHVQSEGVDALDLQSFAVFSREPGWDFVMLSLCAGHWLAAITSRLHAVQHICLGSPSQLKDRFPQLLPLQRQQLQLHDKRFIIAILQVCCTIQLNRMRTMFRSAQANSSYSTV
jgi:hypothetical protein